MKKGLFFLILLTLVLIGVYLIKSQNAGTQKNQAGKNQDVQRQETPVETQNNVDVTTAPVSQISLEISQPADKATVNSAALNVAGKTVPGADVFVNDRQTKAAADGSFSVGITLDEGENSIVIVANDSQGNYAEKELTVTLETF